MRRLRALAPRRLERMVGHYPSQSGAIASMLAPALGVAADQLVVANGACELIARLLAGGRGPVLLSLPTFSAYYELATGPVIPHQLDPARNFHQDFEQLDALIERHRPDTVVIINPNNPDGALADQAQLVDFVTRTHGRVRRVIVDESFAAFTTLDEPPTLAPLVSQHPHLVVINSLSKSHGIAGLRLGYAIAAPLRARRLQSASLWNLNAFAEWFCELLGDPGYQREYEQARRRYIRQPASCSPTSPHYPASRPTQARRTSRCLSSTRPPDPSLPSCSRGTASTYATAPTNGVSTATVTYASPPAAKPRTRASLPPSPKCSASARPARPTPENTGSRWDMMRRSVPRRRTRRSPARFATWVFQ